MIEILASSMPTRRVDVYLVRNMTASTRSSTFPINHSNSYHSIIHHIDDLRSRLPYPLQVIQDHLRGSSMQSNIIRAAQSVQAEMLANHIGNGFRFQFPDGLIHWSILILVQQLMRDLVDQGLGPGIWIQLDLPSPAQALGVPVQLLDRHRDAFLLGEVDQSLGEDGILFRALPVGRFWEWFPFGLGDIKHIHDPEALELLP